MEVGVGKDKQDNQYGPWIRVSWEKGSPQEDLPDNRYTKGRAVWGFKNGELVPTEGVGAKGIDGGEEVQGGTGRFELGSKSSFNLDVKRQLMDVHNIGEDVEVQHIQDTDQGQGKGGEASWSLDRGLDIHIPDATGRNTSAEGLQKDHHGPKIGREEVTLPENCKSTDDESQTELVKAQENKEIVVSKK